MRVPVAAALLLTLTLPPSVACAAEDIHPTDLEAAGDTLQFGVPLLALGLTFLFDAGAPAADEQQWRPHGFGIGPEWLRMNGSPRHDLMLAIGRTELATYSLKYSVDSERPDGGGQSFPSGHTSIAFAGAEFIRKQYGYGWGVPAYLSAGVVGWSRVEAGRHWTLDVLAGAAIGIFSNHDGFSFTLPFGQLAIAPTLMATPRSAGFGTPDSATGDLFQADAPRLAPGLNFEFRF